MSYEDLKIGKLVQNVLKPLILNKATLFEVLQMQELEYSKSTFGIQYPLLLKTSSSVVEKHYYSDLFTLYGDTYRLCCEWFETPTNNDRPYVEKWIREHEETASVNDWSDEPVTSHVQENNPWKDFFEPEPLKSQVTILPKTGIAIGEAQYERRNDLTIIEIPDGVVYIGRSAFSQCENLKEIIFPDSVQVIDDCAFAYCKSLERLKLPENLRWIGRGAFMDCFQLQSVNIPQQVTTIPIYCFDGCRSLEKVDVSGELRIIMDYAFHDCENLSFFSLYRLENLKTICNGAFGGCKKIVFETLDYNVISGTYDVKKGVYDTFFAKWNSPSVMIDKEAFDCKEPTIRTFRDTAGAKMAQELGLKVEYVKDYR